MAKKNTKSQKKTQKKSQKRVKRLIRRVTRDLEELVAIGMDGGAISKEAVGGVLCDVGNSLAGVEDVSEPANKSRKGERFIGYLNKPHGKVLEDGQLLKEEHDQRMMRYIEVLSEEGKPPAEVARILRHEGNTITAAGIRRILAGEG